MNPSAHNNGERMVTSEYLKESGLLLADISTLISRLETSMNRKDDQETFDFSDIETPYSIPESITNEIGPVHAATLHFSRTPEPSIAIELYGEQRSYNATRYTDSGESVTDAILDIPPLDSVSLGLLGTDNHHELEHNLESSDDFETRIHNITGIPQQEFVGILMAILHPNLFSEISPDEIEKLRDVNLFDPIIFEQFADASRAAVLGQSGVIEYGFLTLDEAHLSYIYQDGHPSSFDFTCVNEHTLHPIKIRGDISQQIKIEFPTHVVETGIHKDAIDGLRDFALDLSEIKYVREIIQEEIETLPDEYEDSIGSDIDPDFVAASTNTIDVIEDEIQSAKIARERALDLEIEDDLFRLFNPGDDSAR